MIAYNFFKYLHLYIRYNNILKKIYDEEKIDAKLSATLGNVEFRKDWLGRLYTIINPFTQNIEENKSDGRQSVVFDMTPDGQFTTKSHIEKWIFERLSFANNWMQANNVWELLEYRLERIDNNDNYLFVLQPVPFESLKKWTKYFSLEISFVIIAIIILIIFL